MLKGVKKIKCTAGAVNTGNSTGAVVVEAGKQATFSVAEWFPGTTEEEKKKTLKWVRQSGDRKIDFREIDVPAGKVYALTISKKNSGSFSYYIDASLSGIKDTLHETGLQVRGYCPPKIMETSWYIDEPGNTTQLSSGNPTEYGKPLRLHVSTEGLNGDYCKVQVFNCSPGEDVTLPKTYIVRCVDGEFDLHIPAADTAAWYNQIGLRLPKEQFYVHIFGQHSQTPVPDEKGQIVHATHLFLNNKLGQIIQRALPSTITPAKVGKQEVSMVKFGCKFTAITITDRGKSKDVFDEHNPLSFGMDENKFTFNLKIFYDTDQYEIRADAKPLLNNLVAFLKQNPDLPMLIESYADIRKDDAYNMDLSEKRANGVRSYLYTHGVSNKLTAKFYGESQATQYDYKTNEDNEIHRQNRYTRLTFYTPSLKAIHYNTVVPTITLPETLDINIRAYDTKFCMLKGDDKQKHDQTKARYVELTNEGKPREVARDIAINGGALKVAVFSDITPMLPLVIPPLKLITPNRFALSINSCSYFQDPHKPTVVINAYPDALWLFHGRYDYDGDYFFKKEETPQAVKIIVGIDAIYEKIGPYLDLYFKFAKYIPGLSSTAFVQKLIVDYIREEANMYGLGYHKRWNWPGGKYNGFHEENDYTAEHRLVTETAILIMTVLTIVVEVLIVILTGGEAAVAKLPKLRKLARFAKEAKQVMDKLDSLGFEFVFPKIAMNRGIYFERVSDGNVYYMIEDNVSAKPLLKISYKKTFTLEDFLNNKVYKQADTKAAEAARNGLSAPGAGGGTVKRDIRPLLKAAGLQASMTLIFEGTIEAEYRVRYAIPMTDNIKTGKITVLNKLMSALSNNKGEVIATDSIKAVLKLEAKGKIKSQKWKPLEKFVPVMEIDASVKANIEGYITHTRTYGMDGKTGPYYKDRVYFSGISGSVIPEVKVTVDDAEVYESNKKENTIDFVLLEPFDFEVSHVQLF